MADIGEHMPCSLRESKMDGQRVLTLENGAIRVRIDVDRGAHIFEVTDKRTNVDLLYKDPKGLANHDVGGWYELFPNAGKSCSYGGLAVPGHGDVRNLPWQYRMLESDPQTIRLLMRTESKVLPLALERTVAIHRGLPVLYVAETVANRSEEDQPYLWGHHVTFGQPFIGPECRIDLPVCRLFKRPDYGNESSRLAEGASGSIGDMPGKAGDRVDLSYFPSEPSSEMLFIDGMREHWYNVFNEKIGVGASLAWDSATFPYLWWWEENEAALQAPFNGKVRGMALEPQSSDVPILAKAVSEGRAPILPAGQQRDAWLTLVVHHDPRRVCSVTKEGRVTNED